MSGTGVEARSGRGLGAIAELFLLEISQYRRSLIRSTIAVTLSVAWGSGQCGRPPTVKNFLAPPRWLHVMSRAQLRELMALFLVGSALTLAVFFLAFLLLPFETFSPVPFPRFPGFF